MSQNILPVTPESRFDDTNRIVIPVNFLPLFRAQIANQNKVANKLMFKTWGGLGDQICAEPTLRYALRTFENVDFFLASEKPELFQHLNFKKVYDTREVIPNWKNFFVFETITPPDDSNLVWQFFSHMLTNCVDFVSLCALRMQLPVEEREIFMTPQMRTPTPFVGSNFKLKETVLVHAGRHWQTKTFPKDWWDAVLAGLRLRGLQPVLIGADTEDNRGTVDVDTEGCFDLRNKLTIEESMWLCQRAGVLITNDSSPLHMAASRNPKDSSTGDTWIGYFATCKHPDYITHWRRNRTNELVWQWREENLSLGGIWDHLDYCPNTSQKVEVDKVDPEILKSWLPEPDSVAQWAKDKLNAD